MKNIIKEDLTPIGVQENGEIFGLFQKDRSGILHLFGRPGQGMTITLEEILISDIHNNRGGMIIDPYGDLIKNVQEYVPKDKVNNVSIFEAQNETLDENIARFNKEIDFEEIKNNNAKMLLCKLDSRILGVDLAREIGISLVNQFLQIIDGKQRSLVIDEAHNFLNEEIVKQIINSKEKELSCILTAQTSRHYRTDLLERLLNAANHVLCYYTDEETANLINKYHPEINTDEIKSLEKYNFIVKVNAQTDSPATMKLKGIFPIPYSKNL